MCAMPGLPLCHTICIPVSCPSVCCSLLCSAICPVVPAFSCRGCNWRSQHRQAVRKDMSKQGATLVANSASTMNEADSTEHTSSNEQDGKTFSAFLPPPPIFKPRFVHMQRSSSVSDSPPMPSPKTGSVGGNSSATASSTPLGSQTSTLASTPYSSFESLNSAKAQNGTQNNGRVFTNNSNFLTSSFVSNEEYRNHLLSHSPSISPMTRYTDVPLPEDDPAALANNNGNSSNKMNPNQPIRQAKKRRRSSAYNKEEIERKKRELKTQHSIIEKRRRIKMNREFEALKFLVPACRLNILTGLNDGNFDNSNMMHKLTILQSTVEYIKYLHLIIKLMKLQMLIPKETRDTFKSWIQKNDNLNFVDFDLDLQSYRDIESEFNFEDIFVKVWQNDGSVPKEWLDPITKEIMKVLSPAEGISASESSTSTPEQTMKKEKTVKTDKTQRSQSHPNIHMPSSTLEERIQENSEYRNSILKLQQDSTSFKLPLPAIIDKHPDLGLLNGAAISGANGPGSFFDNKMPSPSSSAYKTGSLAGPAVVASSPLSGPNNFPLVSSATSAYRMNSVSNSSSSTTTSPLKNVLPFPVGNSNRQFACSSLTPRHQFISMPSDYSLRKSSSANVLGQSMSDDTSCRQASTLEGHHTGNRTAAVSPERSSCSSDLSSSTPASVSVSPERKESEPEAGAGAGAGAGADKNSPEIQAASRLLIEIKSNKRYPSIQDILN